MIENMNKTKCFRCGKIIDNNLQKELIHFPSGNRTRYFHGDCLIKYHENKTWVKR
jgi:hypothetical protein